MKIEKVSDTQIRCILTGEDLARRHMKLNELAYGTEKARLLFRDMMQQASYQYGFEADDMPLMVEAVPLSAGSIALIVTKVENPEELDTRFSNFGPSVHSTSAAADSAGTDSGFEELADVIRSTASMLMPQESADPRRTRENAAQRIRDFVITNRLYAFDSMNTVSRAARLCEGRFLGESSLYFDSSESMYYLYLTMRDAEAVQKNASILATLSEYGRICPLSLARKQYLDEHCEHIVTTDALMRLGTL